MTSLRNHLFLIVYARGWQNFHEGPDKYFQLCRQEANWNNVGTYIFKKRQHEAEAEVSQVWG